MPEFRIAKGTHTGRTTALDGRGYVSDVKLEPSYGSNGNCRRRSPARDAATVLSHRPLLGTEATACPLWQS